MKGITSSTRLAAPRTVRERTCELADAATALLEAESTEAVLEALAQQVTRILGAKRVVVRVAAPDEVPSGPEVAALLVGRQGDVWGAIEVSGYTLDEEDGDRDAVLAALASMGVAALEREGRAARERAARERAETEARLKDELLATVSHELRAPLQAILGWTQLLRQQPEHPTGRALEVIERNARSQVELLDDLVDATRVLAGRSAMEPGTLDLAAILQGVCDSLQPVAAARGVLLDASAVPEALLHHGDEPRLRRVLVNLLSHAIRSTPTGACVRVALREEPGSTVVEVRESSRPSSVPPPFERFRQPGVTAPMSSSGLGIGLAIVKHLVSLHGGHVFVDGGAGQAQTFRVVLPAPAAGRASGVVEREAAATPEAPARPLLVGRRVLVVDDDVDALELARTVLEHAGAEVLHAASCAEAINLLRGAPVDAVVSDISMPGEDGYRLLRHMRSLGEPASRTPVLAFTALASDVDRDRALRAGFWRHLAKPVQPHALVRAVEEAVVRAPARAG